MSSSLRLIPTQKGEIVKITSSLGDSSKDRRLNWPSTAVFNTIYKNVDGEGLDQSVKTAIKKGLEETNHICCSCTGDCATNPQCECLKMAMSLKKSRKADVILHGEHVHNPVSNNKNAYYSKPRFVCGPRCSCNKNCSLNALQDIDKNHGDKFEVKRLDAKGFGFYTKKDITAGSPIITFNGEMVGPDVVEEDINIYQYSLQITAHDDPLKKVFSSCKSLSKEYKDQLEGAYSNDTFINPLKKGNVARFSNHSCDPNMEILRVFQGGLSPADLRVVFVAVKDIKGGDELTFNYGKSYVLEHIGTCLCDKCLEKKRTSRKRNNDHLGAPAVTRSQAKMSK